MSKREPTPDAFRQQWLRMLERVGGTRRARLEWVVRQVQQGRVGMTPGERDDLCRELAVFATGVQGGGARSTDTGDIERPDPTAAGEILTDLDRMLTAAAARKRVLIGERSFQRHLIWRHDRYVSEAEPQGYDWGVDAREKLGLLLEEFGHLVKQCPAPARRKKQLLCNTLFVAKRPGQNFCSPRCQAREATKRFRKKGTKGRRKKGGR